VIDVQRESLDADVKEFVQTLVSKTDTVTLD